MRWVFIDTHEPNAFRYGTISSDGIAVRRAAGRSNGLLPRLAREIEKRADETISGVCVVSGPGAFSAVRTGVVAANVLARTWHVPLATVAVAETEDLKILRNRLEQGDVSLVDTALPSYAGEPNITRA